MSMTGTIDRVEVITSVQRRQRLSTVNGREGSDRSRDLCARNVGFVACAPPWHCANQLFRWRRLYAEGALSAVGAGEEVVPASEYRALQHQVRELQRLLGKKTLENEVLRDALELVQPKKRLLRSPSPVRDDTP